MQELKEQQALLLALRLSWAQLGQQVTMGESFPKTNPIDETEINFKITSMPFRCLKKPKQIQWSKIKSPTLIGHDNTRTRLALLQADNSYEKKIAISICPSNTQLAMTIRTKAFLCWTQTKRYNLTESVSLKKRTRFKIIQSWFLAMIIKNSQITWFRLKRIMPSIQELKMSLMLANWTNMRPKVCTS